MVYSAIVVVLNWNQFNLTFECIKSIMASEGVNFKLILVDNGSNDDSSDRIFDCFPNIQLIKIKKNRGFAYGCNYGLEYALKKHSESNIIFVSNDTIFSKSSVSDLIHCATLDSNIGMVVPKIYYFDKPDKIWYAGGKINYFLGRGSHFGFNKKDSKKYNKSNLVTFANGCVFLVKRNLLQTVGLLDTNFFSYAEDTDYSIRVVKSKYNIIYCPKSKIWHKISKSNKNKKSISLIIYYSIRNTIWLQKKYPHDISYLGVNVNIFFLVLKYLVRSILMKDWISLNKIIMALKDGYNYSS